MDWDTFMRTMLEAFPKAQVAEDNDGELIIYTNLRTVECDGMEIIEEMS